MAGGGRDNHPHWSPDGGWIVFTSKRTGYSAEAIALPSRPQPYGDLFAVRADGSGLIRLTHNGFEEGTPAWGPVLDLKTFAGATGKAEDYGRLPGRRHDEARRSGGGHQRGRGLPPRPSVECVVRG